MNGVDRHERVQERAQVRKQLKRSQMLDFFRQVDPWVVAMEACGSACCFVFYAL